MILLVSETCLTKLIFSFSFRHSEFVFRCILSFRVIVIPRQIRHNPISKNDKRRHHKIVKCTASVFQNSTFVAPAQHHQILVVREAKCFQESPRNELIRRALQRHPHLPSRTFSRFASKLCKLFCKGNWVVGNLKNSLLPEIPA